MSALPLQAQLVRKSESFAKLDLPRWGIGGSSDFQYEGLSRHRLERGGGGGEAECSPGLGVHPVCPEYFAVY